MEAARDGHAHRGKRERGKRHGADHLDRLEGTQGGPRERCEGQEDHPLHNRLDGARDDLSERDRRPGDRGHEHRLEEPDLAVKDDGDRGERRREEERQPHRPGEDETPVVAAAHPRTRADSGAEHKEIEQGLGQPHDQPHAVHAEPLQVEDDDGDYPADHGLLPPSSPRPVSLRNTSARLGTWTSARSTRTGRLRSSSGSTAAGSAWSSMISWPPGSGSNPCSDSQARARRLSSVVRLTIPPPSRAFSSLGVPSATMTPKSISAILSATSASSLSWVVANTAPPASARLRPCPQNDTGYQRRMDPAILRSPEPPPPQDSRHSPVPVTARSRESSETRLGRTSAEPSSTFQRSAGNGSRQFRAGGCWSPHWEPVSRQLRDRLPLSRSTRATGIRDPDQAAS